jgi:aspartate/methionine/tyrosine aminotransferase
LWVVEAIYSPRGTLGGGLDIATMLRAFFMTMFSQRTSWDRTPTPLAHLLERKRILGQEILDLTESNPTRCGLGPSAKHISTLLNNPYTAVYHPDPRGLRPARQAIAEWYGRRGISVNPDSVILTAGTSEAYLFLFSLLCDAGDEIVIPRPGYPLLEFLARTRDVQAREYELRYDGEWVIDMTSLQTQLNSRTRAVIVVHPNNPTGSYVKAEERNRINSLLDDKLISLIADEVFWTYPMQQEMPLASFAQGDKALTFVLSGISKVLGLPQLKLSWIIVAGEEAFKEEAIERLEILADLLLSVSMPVQGALPRLMEISEEFAGPIRERVEENLALLHSAAAVHGGVDVLHCEGGWSAILRLPRVHSDEEWALVLLEQHGILVHPGRQFELSNRSFVVVSLLPERKIFTTGIERLLNAVTAAA